MDNYAIKDGYNHRRDIFKWPGHRTPGVICQYEVYRRVAEFCRVKGLTTVIDLGCGDGDKAHLISPYAKIVGVSEDINIIPVDNQRYFHRLIDGAQFERVIDETDVHLVSFIEGIADWELAKALILCRAVM